MSTPAALLTGKALADGWDVTEMLTRPPTGTGGHFSVSYKVKHAESGKEAFLKALDFSGAARHADHLKALQSMLEAYNFERDHEKCKTKRLDKISTPIAHGTISIAGFGDYSSVHYLIFEMAKGGDVRNFVSTMPEFDLAWCFSSLHHIAVGLKQLHWNGIAHQDLKPSNVLVMDANDTKIGDLGRASDQEKPSANDNPPIAGDLNYAPVDLYYGNIPIDARERKYLTDMYLFGSLIFFYFANVNATHAIVSRLTSGQRELVGKGSFQEVLPYLQEAFKSAVDDLKVSIDAMAPDYTSDLIEMVMQLCDPDPTTRGGPKLKKLRVANYDFQRFISKLDILRKSVRNYV